MEQEGTLRVFIVQDIGPITRGKKRRINKRRRVNKRRRIDKRRRINRLSRALHELGSKTSASELKNK